MKIIAVIIRIIIIIINNDMAIFQINNREGLSVTASFSGLKRENKNHSSDMEKVWYFCCCFFFRSHQL